LLDLAVGAQAEVVRQLAHLLRRRLGLRLLEHLAEQAVSEVARPLDLLHVDARDELLVLGVQLAAREQRVDDAVQMLRDRALFRPRRLRELLAERVEGRPNLERGGGDALELARGEPAIVADRRIADELADLLRVLGRQTGRDLDEESAREGARLLERRLTLLLGPVVQAADPEVVVLVEVLLLALREEVAPPLEALLEPGELLVAVDVDPLGLRPHLVLEV